MSVQTGIDLALEYRGRLVLFKQGGWLVMPGVGEIKSGETVQKAALRAAKNYLGQEVELNGTIALYGSGRAGLKYGCKSSLLMSAKITGKPDGWKGAYFASPSETDGLNMDARQRELIKSYVAWKKNGNR